MDRTVFKRDEVILLLGAGASVEAKIPASLQMISKIETLLRDNKDWTPFQSLYFYIKSSIYFADGIKGKFDGSNYNIEKLVNTLEELQKWEEHPLYPFVGAWNAKLQEVAGADLGKISEFRQKIVLTLRDDWVQLEHDSDASYYHGLVEFQEQYQFPLKVFTLNYDLCVEKTCKEVGVERGFDGKNRWDWRQFTVGEHGREAKEIYLYKMHGSVDWTRDTEGFLTFYDSPSLISTEKLAIIFGTTYKLQYVDPFLFFAYEFRRATLEQAKLIIVVGYGFGDEHINGILKQSLDNGAERKLLAVSPGEEEKREKTEEWIARALGIKNPKQITWKAAGAKEFFSNHLKLDELQKLFPEPEEELFDEIAPAPTNPVMTARNGSPLPEKSLSEGPRTRAKRQSKS
jgi:hypothetical protein